MRFIQYSLFCVRGYKVTYAAEEYSGADSCEFCEAAMSCSAFAGCMLAEKSKSRLLRKSGERFIDAVLVSADLLKFILIKAARASTLCNIQCGCAVYILLRDVLGKRQGALRFFFDTTCILVIYMVAEYALLREFFSIKGIIALRIALLFCSIVSKDRHTDPTHRNVSSLLRSIQLLKTYISLYIQDIPIPLRRILRIVRDILGAGLSSVIILICVLICIYLCHLLTPIFQSLRWLSIPAIACPCSLFALLLRKIAAKNSLWLVIGASLYYANKISSGHVEGRLQAIFILCCIFLSFLSLAETLGNETSRLEELTGRLSLICLLFGVVRAALFLYEQLREADPLLTAMLIEVLTLSVHQYSGHSTAAHRIGRALQRVSTSGHEAKSTFCQTDVTTDKKST